MEIAFRKKDATAFFRDERVGVSELSARFIQLETSPARKPNRGNTGVIKSSRELVEPRNEASTSWDEAVNGDVQDEGSVVQGGLRNGASILAENQGQTVMRSLIGRLELGGGDRKSKAGRNSCPLCHLTGRNGRVLLLCIYSPEVVEAVAGCALALGILT